MLRALKYAGLGVAGILAMLVLYIAVTALALRGSLPQLAGTIKVAGPSAAVRIVRDENGIPHIYAKSRDDALFGLGFVHGQDRLWQMEFQRRTVQGRLSEVAGSATLVADTYLRTLGLYRAAEQAMAHLSPDALSALDAYAAGVNAARPKNGKPLPPEFFMLGVEPEPWRPADSVAVLKGLAVQLSANAFQEIFRLQLMKVLGPEKARAFNPPLPPDVVAAYRAYAPKEATKFAEAIDAIAPVMERSAASNNWVVGGAMTASGKPLLANDPHLPLTVPAIWYLAHLSWPGGEAIGGSIPGIPAVVAGRTAHVAWGMTTTGADTQDLFWEKVDPDNSRRYLTASGSEPFDVRSEIIKVRFGGDKVIRLRSTRHGPVLPTDEPRLKPLVPEGYALSLAWPALDPEDKTIETALAIFSLNGASTADVERVFTTYRAPIQSFVLASDAGDVGLILPGTIPIRRPDNPVKGLLPGDGRDPRFEWQGLIPYAEGPHWLGGANDMFVTANNNVVPPGYPHMIALDFEPEHRARRIKTLLGLRDKPFTVASMRTIQLDDAEQFGMDVLPGMLVLTRPTDERARTAYAMLKAWDVRMRVDRPEPLIFVAWMRAFVKALAADELGDMFERVWSDRPDLVTAVVAGEPAAAAFCDDTTTKGTVETCREVLTKSLTSAVAELSASYGDDPAAWRWGTAHAATFSHTPFGFMPVLRDVFGLREPVGGGVFTIQRAAYRYASREPFAAVHGSGYRAVYDLGAPNDSIFMIATGQSGNVYSSHYGDLAPRWARGEYLQMTTDAAAIEAHTAATLVLQPGSDSAR